MASFSKGTSFTDGVTGDVTAAKLHALVDAATPVAGLVTDRTAETSVASGDQVLIADASDSNALKKMTVTNLFKTDVSITSGTGTAGTVAIGPTGDTNTGLFFPAADTIAFAEGGAEAMRIDSSGRVGIGTTTPDNSLEVVKASNSKTWAADANDIFAIENNGSAAIDIRSTAASQSLLLFSDQNARASGVVGYRHTDNSIYISTNATERLRIDSSGRVGIGTSSPASAYRATLTGDGSTIVGGLALSSNSNVTYIGAVGATTADSEIWNAANGYVRIGTNNTERLRIDSDGDVSIGTATALSKLHVHGNITLSNTTTATSAGTGGLTLPASAAGYLTVSINGTSRKIPYYAT